LYSRLCGVGVRSSMMLQGEGEPTRLGKLAAGNRAGARRGTGTTLHTWAQEE
jgi:hypothetical protein